MKTDKLLLIIVTALAVFVLTSFTSKKGEITSGNRIVREYFDGKTFYVLVDYNGKAVGFIEKK